MKRIPLATKEVYQKKMYIFLTIFTALFIFLINGLVVNYKLLLSNFSFSLMFSLLFGIFQSRMLSSLVILILISLLSGVVVAFSLYLIRRQLAFSAGAGIGSILIGVLAPACSSCALGALGLLGLGSLLAFLPFKGAEIGILGIFLLLLSIFVLSKKVMVTSCELRK